jgi:hypothetical protein
VFFTVTSGVDSALSGQTGQTPNLNAAVSPYLKNRNACSNPPCISWLTSSAFSSAAPGTYGNLGYNNIKGPGVFNMDVALSRTFPVREKRTLEKLSIFPITRTSTHPWQR